MGETSNTILVLGAGASFGFGLPLGSGLRTSIATDLNIMYDDLGSRLESGSREIVDALCILVRSEDGRGGNINPHRAAAVQIARSMRLSASIDEYIERHKGDVLKVQCAKLAIAKAILKAERASSIYADPAGRHDPLDNASDSWLACLLRDLTRGAGKDELAGSLSRITIIDFNYDRCVQHFAYHWLQRIYDLSELESANICKGLKIYHPYGCLGPLPHEVTPQGIPFGGAVSPQRLIDIADRIQTYSEAVDELTEPSFVGSDLATARRLVFLGFGFHAQNIGVLGAGGGKRATLQCYASTKDIRKPRLEIIKSQLQAAFQVEAPNGLFFEDLNGDCEAFWDEYGDVVLQ